MRNNVLLLVFILFSFSCMQENMPKPKAFPKISFPKKQYNEIQNICPYTFKIPKYSKIKIIEDCFFNILFQNQNAQLYGTYFALDNDLENHIQYSKSLVYKQNIRNIPIREEQYLNYDNSVYGTLYEFQAGSASSVQFFLTDSVDHFIRGSLYFDVEINDSIMPINNFLKEDIRFMIETFEWK